MKRTIKNLMLGAAFMLVAGIAQAQPDLILKFYFTSAYASNMSCAAATNKDELARHMKAGLADAVILQGRLAALAVIGEVTVADMELMEAAIESLKACSLASQKYVEQNQ